MPVFSMHNFRRGTALLSTVALCSTLAVGLTAEPVHADPACQHRGAYVLSARGSGAKIDGPEASEFKNKIRGAISNIGVASDWAEH